MKIFTLILLFINVNFNGFFKMHPVHISITNVDYNNSENVFDLSIKLFADDFEKIMNKNYNTLVNLGEEDEVYNCNLLINRYVKHHLILKVGSKNLINSLKFIKKEVKRDENSVWIFYKLKYPKSKLIKGKKIKVVNILMNDLYTDQKNLFIFTYKNTKEGYNFSKNKINFEFLIK